jgi:hypothetical protein
VAGGVSVTQAAREVLNDCKGALEEYSDQVLGSAWRRRWVLCVVLLRAVGHVLKKIDGKQSSELESAIDDWWKKLNESKGSNPLFWEFIDKERNLVLKEYEIRGRQETTVFLTGLQLTINGQTGATYAPAPAPAPINHYKIADGYYNGCNQKELIQNAIDWWESQLNEIDRKVASP